MWIAKGEIYKQKPAKNKLGFQLGLRYVVKDFGPDWVILQTVGEEFCFEYRLTKKKFEKLMILA